VFHGGRAGTKRVVPSGDRALFNKLIHDERRRAKKALAAILNAGAAPASYNEQLAVHLPQIYAGDQELFALRLIERLTGALTLHEWLGVVKEFRGRREKFLGQRWRSRV
jgi:hypothetical protein